MDGYLDLRKSKKYYKFKGTQSGRKHMKRIKSSLPQSGFQRNGSIDHHQQFNRNPDLNFEYIPIQSSVLNKVSSRGNSEDSDNQRVLKLNARPPLPSQKSKKKLKKKRKVKRKQKDRTENVSAMSNYGKHILSRQTITETSSVVNHKVHLAPDDTRSEKLRINEILNTKTSAGINRPKLLESHVLNEINSRIQKIESYKNINGTSSYSYAVVRNKSKQDRNSNRNELLPPVPKNLYYNS